MERFMIHSLSNWMDGDNTLNLALPGCVLVSGAGAAITSEI
jgi:hypothetical protein